MNLFTFLKQRFVALCEIPDMYEWILTNSITLQIVYINTPYRTGYGLVIDCINLEFAQKILSHQSILEATIEELNFEEILITIQSKSFRIWSNDSALKNKNPLEILLDLYEQELSKKLSSIEPRIMNNQAFDLNSLYALENPVYIITLDSQKLLFANEAAVLKQQKKPSDNFIGENVSCLSYPEELESRIRMLRSDGKLINYHNKALQWCKNEQKWLRQEVNLITDIFKIEFLGVECRLAIELFTEETGRFID